MLRLISVEDYSMTFKLRWKRRNNAKRIKNKKKIVVVIIQKYICKWMTRCVYLKLLLATTFIQCCWMQMRARKELQRLKQEANEIH
jgi:uncharacterized membrane protein YbaN (DUF454 family)